MINTTADPQMEKYYKFRKEIHKLYDHDVYNTGDLCSKVLEIRDKEKCIESAKIVGIREKEKYIKSAKIALQSYTINIELAADTTIEKQTEIINKVAKCIGYYIVDNRDKIDPKINEDPLFDTYITSYNPMYCDIIVIGKSITFNL